MGALDRGELLEIIDEYIGLGRAAYLAALLLGSPIRGWTRLVKYVFLLQERARARGYGGPTFEFRPFVYGPYSPDLAGALGALQALGVVQVKVEASIIKTPYGDVVVEKHVYEATEEGREVLAEIISRVPGGGELLLLAREIRETWDGRPVRDLVMATVKVGKQY